jgi:hypothetical protein
VRYYINNEDLTTTIQIESIDYNIKLALINIVSCYKKSYIKY